MGWRNSGSHGDGDDDAEVQEHDRPEEGPGFMELGSDRLLAGRTYENREVAQEHEARQRQQDEADPPTLSQGDGRHRLMLRS